MRWLWAKHNTHFPDKGLDPRGIVVEDRLAQLGALLHDRACEPQRAFHIWNNKDPIEYSINTKLDK